MTPGAHPGHDPTKSQNVGSTVQRGDDSGKGPMLNFGGKERLKVSVMMKLFSVVVYAGSNSNSH